MDVREKKIQKRRKAGKQQRIFLSILINFEPCTAHVMSNQLFIILTFTHKNTNVLSVFQIKEQLFPFQLFIAEETIKLFQTH